MRRGKNILLLERMLRAMRAEGFTIEATALEVKASGLAPFPWTLARDVLRFLREHAEDGARSQQPIAVHYWPNLGTGKQPELVMFWKVGGSSFHSVRVCFSPGRKPEGSLATGIEFITDAGRQRQSEQIRGLTLPQDTP